jgi:bifunctional DNA-binding transcriptional regulator/antitoxin component of YhaV-PrlF toxin-antitoxin module
MSAIKQVYEGGDLIIPRTSLEALGIQPGDTIFVRSQPAPASVPLSPEDRERQSEILRRLANAWTEEEIADFEKQRRNMWQQWITFN